MSFGAHARWARCRSAHLSFWSKTVNARLQGHARGLASLSMVNCCVEMRPPAGFAEQQIKSTLTAGKAQTMGVEASENDVSIQIVAALIDGVIADSLDISCSKTLIDRRFTLQMSACRTITELV
eukprot:TRINITY_DN58202_c0_g1_i1.p1 TRINITY_DN58202_c0_g1~~TRINITY_DN58202_c0_g1_i1.p1  ORF type:complete len:124 (-),score=15.17 TRINITY_DN58202_c0_g1_i1:91-462(-)